jgi:hypothetical protein
MLRQILYLLLFVDSIKYQLQRPSTQDRNGSTKKKLTTSGMGISSKVFADT